MAQVFISYSRKDLAFVQRMVEDLKKANLDVWYDLSGLEGGSRWRTEIQNAIKNSQYMIVVLSPNSVESEWVEREFLFASNLKRKIIPLMYKQCELPMNYLNLNFIDVQGKNYRQNFGEILESLSIKPVSGSLPPATQMATSKTGWMATGIAAFVLLTLAAVFALPLLTGKSEPTPIATNIESSKTFTPIPAGKTPTLTSTPTQVLTITPTSLSTEITDAKGVEMILVPAGGFTMGNNKGDGNEKPVHTVDLADYYIDRFTVTNASYKVCADTGDCLPPKSSDSATRQSYYGNPVFDNFPVIYVNWFMAKTYCEWRGARLPTEAEWEKAARGTTAGTYPWGENSDKAFANFDGVDTSPVNAYEKGKSFYGVYDMAGNVWQWVGSLYQPYPYKSNDGRDDPSASGARTLRGGSWFSGNYYIRSTNRNKDDPTSAKAVYSFRCVHDANP